MSGCCGDCGQEGGTRCPHPAVCAQIELGDVLLDVLGFLVWPLGLLLGMAAIGFVLGVVGQAAGWW